MTFWGLFLLKSSMQVPVGMVDSYEFYDQRIIPWLVYLAMGVFLHLDGEKGVIFINLALLLREWVNLQIFLNGLGLEWVIF